MLYAVVCTIVKEGCVATALSQLKAKDAEIARRRVYFDTILRTGYTPDSMLVEEVAQSHE